MPSLRTIAGLPGRAHTAKRDSLRRRISRSAARPAKKRKARKAASDDRQALPRPLSAAARHRSTTMLAGESETSVEEPVTVTRLSIGLGVKTIATPRVEGEKLAMPNPAASAVNLFDGHEDASTEKLPSPSDVATARGPSTHEMTAPSTCAPDTSLTVPVTSACPAADIGETIMKAARTKSF